MAKKGLMGLMQDRVPDASLWDRVKDLGVDALQGAVSLPESFVGLADIPTGGRVGRFIEDYTPVQFDETHQILNTMYSPERQAEQADISRAFDESFTGGLGAALSEPAVPIGSVLQSLPVMLAGRGISGSLVKRGLPAMLGAGIGEGTVTAGSQEEGIRYGTEDRLTTAGQGALALGSGALTGLIGAASNKLGGKLKIADIDAPTTVPTEGSGPFRKIVGGTLMEGLVEELPQSMQEQVATNLATGKPWNEGVSEAGGMGAISGALMGGGMNTAQVVLEKQQEAFNKEIAAGSASKDLIGGSPTLDEEKAAQQAQGAVKEVEQAQVQEAVTQATNPVGHAAQNLGVETEQLQGWVAQTISAVKSFPQFVKKLVQQFGEAAKRFAMQLYNFGKSKLAEDRGSMSLEPNKDGINISTRSDDPFGRALTNPVWGSKKDGKDYFDVETEYKKKQSRKTAPELGPEEALRHDTNLMYQLQREKFRRNPELIDEITNRGGAEFLENSEHTIGAKGSRWEGKGSKSNFIKVLKKAYEDSVAELSQLKQEKVGNFDTSSAPEFARKKEAAKAEGAKWVVAPDGVKDSFASRLAEQAKERGQLLPSPEDIEPGDIVYVSVPGKSRGYTPDKKTYGQLPALLDAGAIVRTDNEANANSKHNASGEGMIFNRLKELGYTYEDKGLYGEWSAKQEEAPDVASYDGRIQEPPQNEEDIIAALEAMGINIRQADQKVQSRVVDLIWQSAAMDEEQSKQAWEKIRRDLPASGLTEEDAQRIYQQAVDNPKLSPSSVIYRGLARKDDQTKSEKKNLILRKKGEETRKTNAKISEMGPEEKSLKLKDREDKRPRASSRSPGDVIATTFKQSAQDHSEVKKVAPASNMKLEEAMRAKTVAGRSVPAKGKRIDGVYVFKDGQATDYAADNEDGGIYFNVENAEKVFKDNDFNLLPNSLTDAIYSLGINAKELLSIFKTQKEFNNFLLNQAKAQTLFNDPKSEIDTQARAILAALTPVQRVRAQSVWEDRGTMSSKAIPRSDQRDLRKGNKTSPPLAEEERDIEGLSNREIGKTNEQARLKVAQNEAEESARLRNKSSVPEITDDRIQEEEDEYDYQYDEDDYSKASEGRRKDKKSGVKHGAIDQEGMDERAKEMVRNADALNKEEAEFVNMKRQILGIRKTKDLLSAKVRNKITKFQIDKNQKEAMDKIKEELASNENLLMTSEGTDPRVKTSVKGDRTPFYDELIKDFERVEKAGLYLPDVLSFIKKNDHLSNLGNAANGYMPSFEALVQAVRKENPKLWPRKLRVVTKEELQKKESQKEVVKEQEKLKAKKRQKLVRKPASLTDPMKLALDLLNNGALKGNNAFTEILKEYEKSFGSMSEARQKRFLVKVADIAQTQGLKEYRLKKFKQVMSGYRYIPSILPHFFKEIIKFSRDGSFNEARFLDFRKIGNQIASKLNPKKNPDYAAFKNLSQEDRLRVTKGMFYLANSLKAKPIETFIYNQNEPSYLAENFEIDRSLPSIDKKADELDYVVIDEMTEGVASFFLLNTKGNFVRDAFFYDNNGKFTILRGQKYADIQKLIALQEKELIKDLKTANPISIADGRTVVVEMTNSGTGETYRKPWTVAGYLNTLSAGKFKGKVISFHKMTLADYQKYGYQEPIASWESTKDQLEFIEQNIAQMETTNVITREEADNFKARLELAQTKEGKEEVIDQFAQSLKARFVEAWMKRTMLFNGEQVKALVDPVRQFGITEDDVLNAYVESGASMRYLKGYIQGRILDAHQKMVTDAISKFSKGQGQQAAKNVVKGKAVHKDAMTVLKATVAQVDPDGSLASKFEDYIANKAEPSSLIEKTLFPAMKRMYDAFMGTVTKPKLYEYKGKAKVSPKSVREIQPPPVTIGEWATFKSSSGFEVQPQDIGTTKTHLTDFEKELQGKEQAHDPAFRVLSLRSKKAKVFFNRLTKIFGARLVVVSSDTYRSRYTTHNGEPQLVVNIKQGTSFTEVFAHEFFHHVVNRASDKEYAAFVEALSELSYRLDFKVPKGMTIAQAKEYLANEEIQAKLFSQIITHNEFYDVLANKAFGKGFAHRLISHLIDRVRSVINLFSQTISKGRLSFEENTFIAQSDIGFVYETFANLLADAYQGQSKPTEDKFFGGVYTDEIKGHFKDSKNWLNGIFRKIFPKGSKSYKDIMTNIEDMTNKFFDKVADIMPKWFLTDWRSSMASKALINDFLNRGALAEAKAYHQVLKKHDKTFKGMSDAQMMKIIDFFARGVEVKDEAGLRAAIEQLDRDIHDRKVDRRDRLTILEALYKKFTTKVKDKGPINLNDPADRKMAIDRFGENVVKAFEDYKAFSDKAYNDLKRLYPGLEYNADHFGMSIRWYRESGELLDDDIASIVKEDRWNMFRNKAITTEGLMLTRKLEYREINPNQVMQKYIRDVYNLLAVKELEDNAIRAGKARILPVGMGKRFGLVEINNEVFDKKGESTDAHEVGYGVYRETKDGEQQLLRVHSSLNSAVEEMNIVNAASNDPNTKIVVQPVEYEAKTSTAAKTYFAPDLAKMLNVALGKDKFRNGKFMGVSGEWLLKWKNSFTMVEFALSLFHFLTISQEMMSLFSIHSWETQKGLKKLSGFNIRKGGIDIEKAHALLIAGLEDPSLIKTAEFKKIAEGVFGKSMEDVGDAFDMFYRAGGRIEMDNELRGNVHRLGKTRYTSTKANYKMKDGKLVYTPNKFSGKALADSIKEVYTDSLNNQPSHIKALFKTVAFAGLESSTAWLMDSFIPKVKFLAFMRFYLMKVEQSADQIKAGKMTKEKIADETMKDIEDKLGEVNWAQQHMGKSFKSLLQFTFRSFTWFTGSWKALGKAGIDMGKLGWFTLKGKGIGSKDPNRYRLTEKGKWGISAVVSHMVTAAIFSTAYMAVAAAFGGEVPDDEDTPLITKLLFPRGDRHDPYSRLTVPSYVTEAYKIFHHLGVMGTEFKPSALVTGRTNTLISNALEVFEGKDFRGVVIRDERDMALKQLYDSALHMMNVAPISISSAFDSYRQKGFDPTYAIFSLMGMTQAPAVAKRSGAANLAFQIRRKQFSGGEVSPDEMELRDRTKRAAYRYGQGDQTELRAMHQAGEISPTKFKNALQRIPRINDRPNPRYIKPIIQAFKGLTLKGAQDVWDYASDNEKKMLKPYFKAKFLNAVRRRTISKNDSAEIRGWMRERGVL